MFKIGSRHSQSVPGESTLSSNLSLRCRPDLFIILFSNAVAKTSSTLLITKACTITVLAIIIVFHTPLSENISYKIFARTYGISEDVNYILLQKFNYLRLSWIFWHEASERFHSGFTVVCLLLYTGILIKFRERHI